jgi:pimeloyl-ACP methyl ester carboxylesterase
MKMFETKSAGPQNAGGRVAAGFVAPVEAGERSEGGTTATGPAQSLTPRGLFFANPTFHFETLRNAGYIVSNCADLGEIFETIKVISEGDPQSWYTEWEATAERVLALAERTRDPLSKGGAYMRASTYQRMAEFLLPPDDPRRPLSLEQIGSYFLKGLDTLGVRYERMSVPYEAGSLRAVYFPGPPGAETKPLIMFGGGFDSILEEYYPNIAEAALRRGYSVLTYEGPGQGEALRKYGLTYTAEWEKPVAAMLDAFLRTHAKPSSIVLIGMSMGGYFAPRAGAFEQRIDGIVAYGTMYDFGAVLGPVLAAAKNPLARSNTLVSWAYRNALWTMGTKDADETIQASAAYALAPVAGRIRQHVLILAGAEDHFVPLQQTAEFEKGLVNARSVTTRIFDRRSGGAGHCQPGALTLYHAAVFDWLLEKFPARPTG